MPLSTRALMVLLREWVRRGGMDGYLCLDDVVVGREGFREEVALGRVDLLVRQEAQGLRVAYSRRGLPPPERTR